MRFLYLQYNGKILCALHQIFLYQKWIASYFKMGSKEKTYYSRMIRRKYADMDSRIGYLSILETAPTTKRWNPIFSKDQDISLRYVPARIQYYSLEDMIFQRCTINIAPPIHCRKYSKHKNNRLNNCKIFFIRNNIIINKYNILIALIYNCKKYRY